MEFSIEIKVGDARHFLDPDNNKLVSEPVLMSGAQMESVMQNFEWENSAESEVTFIIRRTDGKITTVSAQNPDSLFSLIMAEPNVIIKNTVNHRQLWYDFRNQSWVVTEHLPSQKSPKVLHRTVSTLDASKFLEGTENE